MIREWALLPRAVFISIFELGHILSENLLTLLAGKDDFNSLFDFVVFFLSVALSTVEPLLAAGSANLDLGIQNMLAHIDNSNY